jgi:glycosyltransferase involved in cell wall biosynthesis
MHLLMVGEGDQQARAMEMVKELGIGPKVTFQSFRQDVPDVLAAADIFVLPSLWEGLPIGLLEAMAMGKAVIASDVDGTSEIVQDRINGLKVNTDQLAANLEKALLTLSGDPGLRKQFGVQAIETVRGRYNAARMTRQIENIYRGLVSPHSLDITKPAYHGV